MRDTNSVDDPRKTNDHSVGTGNQQVPGSQHVSANRLMNNRTAMFVLLFCVTGFLGLPLLWRSQAFSRQEKVLWSALVMLYTCALLWITASIVRWSLRSIWSAAGW